MAAKVIVCLGDSISNGNGSLAAVTAADFTRWTGTTWPSGATAPADVSVPDVYMFQPRMPYGISTTSYVASATSTSFTLTNGILENSGTDIGRWVYVKSGTGRGQRRRISQFVSATVANIGTAWTTTPDTTSVIEYMTDSRTYASLSHDTINNQTTITQVAVYSATYDSQTVDLVDGDTLTFTPGGTATLIQQLDATGSTGTIWFTMISGALPGIGSTIAGSPSLGDGVLTSTPTAHTTAWVNTPNTWVGCIDGTGLGQWRRVVSASGASVVVTPVLITTPGTNAGFRQLTGTNTVNAIADITAAKAAVRNLRFYADGTGTSYSDPYTYPNFYGSPLTTPLSHAAVDAMNPIPELLWRMRADFDEPIYCVHVAAGGATLAPFNISNLGDLLPFAAGAFSWGVDVDHNDFNPASTNGLYDVLQAYVTAMASILGAIDVQLVCTSLGTNDALDNEKANQFLVGMETLKTAFRSWLAANGHTTLKASSIPWVMDRVGPTATRLYSAAVNAAIDQIASDDPYAEAVDVSDVAFGVDTVHPTQEGAITIGERRYTAWREAKAAIADATTPDLKRDTLSTIRSLVRRRYERATSSTDTSADDIDYYINEGLRKIYNRLGDKAWFLVLRDTVTLSADYPAMAELPLVMSRPLRFEHPTYPTQRINWRAAGRTNEGRYLITFEQTMPSEVIVFYRAAPDDLSEDGDVCLVPHEHIELVVLLACRGIAEASGNASAMAMYAAELQELWALLMADADRFRQQFERAMDGPGGIGEWAAPLTWGL